VEIVGCADRQQKDRRQSTDKRTEPAVMKLRLCCVFSDVFMLDGRRIPVYQWKVCDVDFAANVPQCSAFIVYQENNNTVHM